MKECDYCKEREGHIAGKVIRTHEWKLTSGYRTRLSTTTTSNYDYLNMFILKGKEDKYAGLMIDIGNGARYVDIKYCPFCGKKLGG